MLKHARGKEKIVMCPRYVHFTMDDTQCASA